MGKRMMKILKSRKGGIPTIITIVATTIVAMGLFSYTILNQSTSVKESGDKALLEQDKINILLDNPDYVTGKIVLSYFDKLDAAAIDVWASDGVGIIDKEMIDKQSIFEFEPTFGENGKIESAEFTRVDLGT